MKRAAVLLAVMIAASACTATTPEIPEVVPTASPSESVPPVSPPPSEAPEPPPASMVAMVVDTHGWEDVYDMAAWDIWHYDVASGTVTRMTTDGRDTVETDPHLIDEDTVVYAVNEDGGVGAIMRLELGEPEPLELVTDGRIQALDPSPDGSKIAYLVDDFDETGLKVRIYAGGEPTTLRSIIPDGVGGREGFQGDELRIAWSPDGSMLLVTYTPHDFDGDTMFVINAETGVNVVPPRFGTFGRWSPDSTTVYWRRFDAANAWRALNVVSGDQAPIALGKGYRPSVSPDGTRIVYDDGDETPRVKVYDIGGASNTKIKNGFVDVRWIDTTTVIGGGTQPCSEIPECFDGLVGQPWGPSGASRIFPATGGAVTLTDLPTTWGADAFYA